MMVLYVAVLGVFLVYVLINETGYVRYIGREVRFLTDFDEFLSNVRHFYYYSNSAEDAIFYSIPKCSKRIRPMLEELLAGLESEDRVRMLSSAAGAQHKFVRLFLSLTVLVSDNGDVMEESSSVFLDSVMQLRSDVQSEKRYLESRRHRFAGLALTAALPPIAVPLVAAWGSDTIPSLRYFYYGRNGAVVLCAILALTVMCYEAIIYLREGKGRKYGFAKLSEMIGQRAGRYYRKVLFWLGDIEHERYVLALLTVLIMVPVLIAGHSSARSLLVTDTGDIENVSDTADGNQITAMKRVITEYMSLYTGDGAEKIDPNAITEKDALAAMLLDEKGIRSKKVAEDTAAELIRRLNQYYAEYFGLPDALIVLIAAILAWLFPGLESSFKKALEDGRRQDEVMQFQSLIHMQKKVPGITPVEILESMESFSDIFRNSLQQCINNYNVNDELALTELAEAESYTEFRKLTDCFLAIDEAGIENAFEEVTAQISNFKENRELDRNILLDNHVLLASMLAILPGGMVLFGYLLIPFMARAMVMFNNYQDSLHQYLHESR